jgi:hypothetical protein
LAYIPVQFVSIHFVLAYLVIEAGGFKSFMFESVMDWWVLRDCIGGSLVMYNSLLFLLRPFLFFLPPLRDPITGAERGDDLVLNLDEEALGSILPLRHV